MTVLSRITSVPPREIWRHEALEFTPWLAQPDNIALLAEALSLDEVEVEAMERDVGRFSADIVARDTSGMLVLIENQLEATDHRHLGQVITYLAGLQSDALVVWIATHFHEEHRAAIDWLNANTNDRFNFVGIEIEVLRIGDSPPAPRFSLVAKPNDWTRSVGALSRAATAGELAERHKVRIGYWTSFADYVKDAGGRFRVRPNTKTMWHTFAIGRSGVVISATVSTDKRRIGVELYLRNDANKTGIRALEAERTAIEAEFGEPLEWQELPGKRASRVVVYRHDVDPSNVATYPDLHAWMLDRITRMRRVFGERVKRLDLSVEIDDEEVEPEDT
ncbi:DUF4268 domain-containing protein [Acuticoccus kandeliae]|uniref:DUF4268 domain-containing protein n=1 Tax=Acuticoccus kandeliae TaxID=2073160 RepID=UPI000D3E936F|nr:DUF4268 domain-containing protein [Acuticoccus kandeliae]